MNLCTYPCQYVDVSNVAISDLSFSSVQGPALSIQDVWKDTEVKSVHFRDLGARGAEIYSKWKSCIDPR